MRLRAVDTKDLDYSDPSILVNVFARQREGLTVEERRRDDEDFQSFCDWLLVEEIDDETY